MAFAVGRSDPGMLATSGVPERIALAREELKQRMQMAGLNAYEQRAIVDALNNLHAVELNEKSRGQLVRGA